MIVCVHKTQLRCDLLVGAKQVQQPDQHELIVWSRINPQFDRVKLHAEFEETDIARAETVQPVSTNIVEPMIAWIAVLCRPPLQPRQKLLFGRQFPPDEARAEAERNIRQFGLAKRVCRKMVRREDQM